MKNKIVASLLLVILSLGLVGCSESWDREVKNFESDFGGGLNRTVKVYSATGELITTYTGKFDIDYSEERILFDDEKDKRHVIYFKNGTVTVDEK